MTEACPWIVSANAATFEREVMQRSREVPVIVDFWAPWCGPCRMLAPILEKLAREKAGAFILVKVNTDESPELAQMFGVRGIPAVFALRDGQVVDYFTGALPESELRAWLEGVIPQADEALVAEAEALVSSDPRLAEAKYREALARNPQSVPARVGLARLFVQQRRLEEARTLVNELTNMGVATDDVEQLRTVVELASAGAGDDLRELAQQVSAAPRDWGLRLKYAKSLIAAGRYQEALDEALKTVTGAADQNREEARKLMVQVFGLLGDSHPLTEEYRRRLTMALF